MVSIVVSVVGVRVVGPDSDTRVFIVEIEVEPSLLAVARAFTNRGRQCMI